MQYEGAMECIIPAEEVKSALRATLHHHLPGCYCPQVRASSLFFSFLYPAFGKVVACLSRIGEDLYFEPRPGEVSVGGGLVFYINVP